MPRLLAASALFVLTALSGPESRADEFKDLADLVTKELWTRQTQDGAYGDVVTTARSLSALRRTPRNYSMGDGPLVVGAVRWLEKQFDEEGRARGVPAEHQGLAAAWCVQAVEGLRDEKAQELVARCAKFAAAHPASEAPEPGAAAHGLDALPAPSAERARELLAEVLGSDDAVGRCGEIIRALETLAAQDGAQHLEFNVGATRHEGQFALLAGNTVAEPIRAKNALKGLESGVLADLCRVLSLCSKHAVRDSGGGGAAAEASTRVAAVSDDLRASYTAAAERALEYLATQQTDGRFEYFGRPDPGVTAMALTAVSQTCRRLGREAPDYVEAGLNWLVSLQDENGSIHDGNLKVYVTSTAVLALDAAGRGERDAELIARAQAYLIAVQSDEAEGFDSERDAAYGGIGYGGDLRPDMSNTQFAIESLARTEAVGREVAFKRALTFLQRCQNDPESNDKVIERPDGRKIQPGTDGGAMYYPGNSKAGLIELENGNFVARSYGSMTYALLKCYMMCGLPLEDPRVQAALNWIQENYTLEYNPGFIAEDGPSAKYQGLYYYYFTMAKALDLSGLDVVKTPDGRRHAWRDEMIRHLLQDRFRAGYWSNDRSARWWEELPTLATAYTLTALDHCLGED